MDEGFSPEISPEHGPDEGEEELEQVDFFEEQGWLLRVSDLKQYSYCPRVVYYTYCVPGVRPTTFKMRMGEQAQKRVSQLETRRSLRAYGLKEGKRHFHVTLRSWRLGLSGQIDLVIETEEGGKRRAVPVDFKLSRRQPGPNLKVQLACYALLLEEGWQVAVEEGFIYLIPSRRGVRVPMTRRLLGRAKGLVAEVRAMVESQRMPPPTPRRARCVDCEFRRFCNDVL